MAEDPTRSQQPPRGPGDPERHSVYEEEVEAGPSRLELADQARSSRNWAYAAAFLGILAAGLGAVAIIFSLGDDDRDGRQGASRSSVSEVREDVESLQERVDELEQQTEGNDDLSSQLDELESSVDNLSSGQDNLSEELSAIEERVGQLEDQPAPDTGGRDGGTGGGTSDGDTP